MNFYIEIYCNRSNGELSRSENSKRKSPNMVEMGLNNNGSGSFTRWTAPWAQAQTYLNTEPLGAKTGRLLNACALCHAM